MRNLQKANSIQSIREVWWDIRPHPGFGTVEVRVCDAVPSVEEMVNLAAFIQCLVVGLSNFYDDGAQLPILNPWVIHENNQAPYQRQIMQYNKDNEFSDIILSAINDLEKGMVAVL